MAQTPDQILVEIEQRSDIARRSAAGVEIDAMLKRHGLDVIAWTLENRTSSACARTREGGGSERCPVLQLNIRRQKDYDAENIDPHVGNWDDAWGRTEALRDNLNAILTRHGFGDDFVSQRSFIFPHSWEDAAFDCLGRLVKPKVTAAIAALVPPKGGWFSKAEPEPKYVFWRSSKQYVVVFSTGDVLKRAAPLVVQMEEAAARLIKAADVDDYCSATHVSIELMHMGTPGIDLHGMSRED